MDIMSKGQTICLFLAGATRRCTQKATPTDRLKLYLLGIAPLIPTITAFFAGGFAASTFLTRWHILAWVVWAPLFAGLILMVEILLNASISPGALDQKKKWVLGTRIILSLLISFTLAVPLKLALFDGPVRKELDAGLREELNRMEAARSPQLEQSIWDYEQASAQYDLKEKECQSIRTRYFDEMDGLASGRSGVGRIALNKKMELTQCDNERKHMFAALATLGARLGSLRQVQEARNNEDMAAYASKYPQDLIARLEALGRVARKKPMIGLFGIMIVLLLAGFDTLPTLIKFTTLVPSYTAAARVEEQQRLADLEAQFEAHQRITAEKSKALIHAAVKDSEQAMLKKSLSSIARKLEICNSAKERFETMAIYHQVTERLDLKQFVSALDELQQMLRLDEEFHTPQTRPRGPEDEPPAHATNERTNWDAYTRSRSGDRPPRKRFVLNRIV